MKAVMYHYVRPVPEGLPYFRYLHKDDFAEQLDYFQAEFGLYTLEEFKADMARGDFSSGKVVLTFDDGFKDHIDYAMPEIIKRGSFGFFYINTYPYRENKVLNVHRIHYLLGKYGGEEMTRRVWNYLKKNMLSFAGNTDFQSKTYTRQSNDDATREFKRVMNYYIAPEHQTTVLDYLMEQEDEAALLHKLYLSKADIKVMHDAEMVIGSHSVSHQVMSKLSAAEQRDEIYNSFADLEAITGAFLIKSFCYPYGGDHTFTRETEAILKQEGCALSFSVDPRDVTNDDFANRPQALPRYDCNLFPYGKAMMGAEKPE